MSQYEVLQHIEKHPDKWFEAKDLQQELGYTLTTIHRNMKKIAKSNFAQYKKERDKSSRNKLYIKHNQNI